MELQILEQNNQRVLTTKQLVEAYETDARRISENYNRNKERYVEGKHFFLLQGEELKAFKSQYARSVSAENTNKFYLWTEKGAWLHAKSLNTDAAWDAYELLVDDYYNIKQQLQISKADQLLLQVAHGNDPLTRTMAAKEYSEYMVKEATVPLIEEHEEQLEHIREVVRTDIAPKLTVYEQLLNSKGLWNTTQIAQDYGMSANKLNKLLMDNKVQYRSNGQWVLTCKYKNKGYVRSDDKQINGRQIQQTKWTGKGKIFIYAFLKKKLDILPIDPKAQEILKEME